MVCALLVENNNHLPADWRKAIAAEEITLKIVPSLSTGIKSLHSASTDLIFISGLPPASEATQFCQQLRQSEPGLKARNDLPILLITAPGDYDTAITLLDAGADEVWLQSMPLTEFVSRLRAVVRRLRNLQSDQFRRGDFILQPRSRQASFSGINLNLRPEEYDLLELFVSSPDRVFSESILLRMIWPQAVAPDPLQLSEIVTDLNYKLAVAGSAESLELLYGLGWHWRSQPKTIDSQAALSTADTLQIPNRQAIWQRYRHEYWQRLDRIAIALAGWNQMPTVERSEAYRHAQTLAGALGSFGFEKESQSARILAAGLHSLELETEGNPVNLESLLTQVQQLRVLLGASESLPPVRSLLPLAPTSAIKSRRLHNQIEVWSRDQRWAEEVATKANLRGLGATIRPDPDRAVDLFDAQSVDLLILDLDPQQLEDARIVDWVQSQHHLPILLVSDGSLSSRIQAARLGSQRFFPKPISAEVLLEQAFTLLEPSVIPSRLLIADNDPALLTYLQQLLQPWGWNLTLCKRGAEFWDVLESSQPDLIIVDAALPDYNGLELCRVLRSDRYWFNQPVLILAEHHDSELVQQALRYGADDVIPKPIVGSELVVRIYNRLEKYRQLQRLTAIDNLTGLVNQRRGREVLSLLMGLAQRYRQPLTLVVLQITPPLEAEAIAPAAHLQQLIQLAARLQRCCRREDVVARWTDEQFVLGFYGVSWAIAIQRLEQVQLLLQSKDASANQPGWSPIRISAGVAEFPIHGTDLPSLVQTATDVLNQAIEPGGDRIVVAEGRAFSRSAANSDSLG